MRSTRAILAALCLLPSLAWASLAFDTTANPSSAIIKATEQNPATTGSTITTSSFSTGGTNRLLLAMLVADSSALPFPATLATTGVTWTKRASAVDAGNFSGAALYTAPASSTLSSVTVSATLATAADSSNHRVAGLYVWAIFDSNGAMPNIGNFGTGIVNGTSVVVHDTVNVSITGSWLFGAFIQTNGDSVVLTADTSTTADVNFTATAFGDTWLICRYKNNPTTATGNQTIGSTATDSGIYGIAMEITPGVVSSTVHHRPLMGVGL